MKKPRTAKPSSTSSCRIPVNSIVSESWNGLRLVVIASSDTRPPQYYVIDRRDQKLQPVASHYPELAAEDMAPMQLVSYAARDGLEIPGFLTVPMG